MQTKVQEIMRRRFTVHEYHRMAEAGILHEDDRVELIEGDVVMNPIGSRHAMCVIRLNRLLVPLLGDEALVSPQNPVRLGEYWEPQPDLAVIRARNYASSLPGPEDVLFLIEVCDTTLRYDREVKLPLYARARIRRPGSWTLQAKPSNATRSRPRMDIASFDRRGGGERCSSRSRCPLSLYRLTPSSADTAVLTQRENGQDFWKPAGRSPRRF